MTRSQMILVARPGPRDELLALLDRLEILSSVQDEPGFLGASVLVPLDDQDRVVVEGSWSSPEHFERWRVNPRRARLLVSILHLLTVPPEHRLLRLVDALG